jgi:paxillin
MRLITFVVVSLLLMAMVVPAYASTSPAKAPICAACGKPITGPSFSTKGAIYHADCFRCAYCNRPINGPYSEYKGKNYHNDCFEHHVALKCALCGDIIRGE